MALGRFSITYGSSTGFGGGFGIFDALKGTLDSETQLVFPWRELGIHKTLTSSRAQSYLRWLQRQPGQRRLKYLDKVLGLTKHKYRSQYPKHLQRSGNKNSNR